MSLLFSIVSRIPCLCPLHLEMHAVPRKLEVTYQLDSFGSLHGTSSSVRVISDPSKQRNNEQKPHHRRTGAHSSEPGKRPKTVGTFFRRRLRRSGGIPVNPHVQCKVLCLISDTRSAIVHHPVDLGAWRKSGQKRDGT